MTDRNKVIAGLKYHYNDDSSCMGCPYHNPKLKGTACSKKLMEDMLEMLKEQEAVKPVVAVDTWVCPKCGHTLESQSLIDDKENPQVLVHEQYNFCPNCGKMVKWE